MAESRSYAPPPLCAETAVDAAAELDGVPVNARLRKHLLLCQASPQQPQQRMASAAFLDALARYPLPVVSAATARDVAGWERQWQLCQQSTCSPSRPILAVSGEPAPAAPPSAVQMRRCTVTLRGEGRMSSSDPSQAAAAELTAAIHQFWALSSAPVSSAPPHPPLLPAIEEDLQSPLRTVVVSGLGPAPHPPPPWAAFSPFRFCADPSFHAALQCLTGCRNRTGTDRQLSGHVVPHSRRSRHLTDPCFLSFPAGASAPSASPAGEDTHDKPSSVTATAAVFDSAPDGGSTSSDAILGAPWTSMDAWCHGFAAAADGGCRRKRGRTATTTVASPVSAEPTTSAHSRFMDTRGEGKATLHSRHSSPATRAMEAAQDTLRADPSPDSIAPLHPSASPAVLHEAADALQSRVNENDDLLELLLGAEQSACRPREFAGGLPCARARLTGAPVKADTQPHRKREDEQTALPERGCAATASGTGAGWRSGMLAVRAGVDGLPAPSAQSSRPTPASSSTALDSTALMRSGPVMGSGAEEGSSCGAGDGNRGKRSLPSTVKDLRDTCARLGLLSTGSKATLQQRLRLHYASAPPPQHSDVCVPLVAAAAKMSSSPLVPLDSGAMRSGSGAGASHSAGSPPRTVFRYRSPSPLSDPGSLASAAVVAADQQRTCTMEAVTGPTTRTGATAEWEQAAASASPTGAAAGQRGRLVPSPTQFLHDLASRKPQTPSVALAGLCNPHALSSAAAMRAQQEELTSETGRVRWQWLVDFRERAGAPRGGGSGRRQHEGMLEAFRKQHVPCTSVMLPAGDFMLSVELSPEEAAGMDLCGVAANTETGGGVPNPSITAEGAAPVLSHVCSLVVERKTAADLDASVKGARYAEQRRLLAVSPFRLVVWLVEGTDIAGGCGSGFLRGGHRSRQGGGGAEVDMLQSSRSPSPTPSSPAESARQRVDSACASLGLQGKGWLVVRTRSTAESVQFLKLLATHVTRQLASHRLRCRCRGKGESAVPVSTGFPVAFNDATQHLACADGGDGCFGSLDYRCSVGDASTARISAAEALLKLIPTNTCLHSMSALQRHMRAKTAFPRMLRCVRGCSAALASLISSKYGTLLRFWRELRQRGQEACDADPDIQRLSTAQKKVYVLLTEFLLAKEYF